MIFTGNHWWVFVKQTIASAHYNGIQVVRERVCQSPGLGFKFQTQQRKGFGYLAAGLYPLGCKWLHRNRIHAQWRGKRVGASPATLEGTSAFIPMDDLYLFMLRYQVSLLDVATCFPTGVLMIITACVTSLAELELPACCDVTELPDGSVCIIIACLSV